MGLVLGELGTQPFLKCRVFGDVDKETGQNGAGDVDIGEEDLIKGLKVL